jgi:YVTN family beta-propeller protein
MSRHGEFLERDHRMKNSGLCGRIAAPVCSALVLLVIAVASFGEGPAPGSSSELDVDVVSAKAKRLARPISLAFLQNDQHLLVANRDSASITTIDPKSRTVLGEWQVPGATQLTEMLVSRDQQWLIVCNQNQNRVWLLRREQDQQFSVLESAETSEGPVGLSWRSETEVMVACQWSRMVQFFTVDPTAVPGKRLTLRDRLELPFAPRKIIPIGQANQALVADSFGGSICLIETTPAPSRILRSSKKIAGHNVRGLGLMPDGKNILVAHQTLNPMAETTHEGVFWGTVMSNNLRLILLQALAQETRTNLEETGIHFLGQPNQGAADPTSLLITQTQLVLTTLGGADELAVCQNLDQGFDRIKVGRRPVSVVTDPECKLAYVANQFSDTISVVHLVGRQVVAEIPLLTPDESRSPTLAEQGESLFYDASLSLDGWFSCHSCHTDGHTNGLLNSNLSDGTYKAAKRIPSLLGVSDTGPYLWNGQFDNLNDQIEKSVVTTMQGKPPTEHQNQALAAYLQSLAPPARLSATASPQVKRGQAIFQVQGCATCHAPPTFTSKGIFDVGLKDQNGRTEFNPPSLRGLRFRGPFFHDLRAATLDEVFVKHQHPVKRNWKSEDLADLIEYLNSL